MQDCSEGRRCIGAPFFKRNDEPSGDLVGVAVKWLRLGSKSHIDLDVFSQRYAAGLIMRTTR